MARVLAPWRTTITQPLEYWVGEVTSPIVQPENPIHRMTFLGAFAER